MDYLFESATCRRWRIGWLFILRHVPAVTSIACLLLTPDIYIILLKKHHGTMGAMTRNEPFSGLLILAIKPKVDLLMPHNALTRWVGVPRSSQVL